MTTTSDEECDKGMQVSIKFPSLPEIISQRTSESIERNDSLNEQTSSFLLKPVCLSAFLKELEEAANEPIPDIKCSSDVDESDETDNKDDEELLSLGSDDDGEISKIEIKSKAKTSIENNTKNFDKCEFGISELELGVRSLATPAKSTFSNFLTPNIMNSNKPIFKGFSTQVQDKNRLKIHCQRKINVNNLTPLNAIPFLNRDSIKKESLVFSQNKSMTCNENIIYEEHEILQDKENMKNRSFRENQKILCSIPAEKPILDPFEKIVVSNVEYVILNHIGRGGSSVVFHCYDPIQKCERAIKRVNLTGDPGCVEGYINEVKMLHKLQNCDKIIKMFAYEIIENEKVLYMVLEKGERDLSKILKELSNNTDHLPMYMLIYYWMEMLYAVKQIHANGIIHSDLKPANFLMVSSKLKLIDFGIASSIQNDMTSVVKNVQIGSFNYISPEALSNNSRDSEIAKFKISFKSDVWSLGCILYQLVYRKTPFQHIGHTYAKLSAIVDPKHVIEYPQVDKIPQNIVKTIKSCLRHDMKSRPSIDDLIRHFENMYY